MTAIFRLRLLATHPTAMPSAGAQPAGKDKPDRTGATDDSPQRVSNSGGISHLRFELVNVVVVVLQRLADGILEGVYLDKVREQG